MSLSGIVGFLLAAVLSFKAFFSSMEDFMVCLKYYLTPDFWSFIRGEYHQDSFAEMKIFFWLGLSALIGYGMHQVFN